MAKEVQRVRTEVSEPQMAQAIIEAWGDLFKTVPSKEQVSLILAQNALETGGRKSMWNNNIGNIKASTKGPYDYFYLRGPEQTAPGKWEQLRMAFRAYPTLVDGVKDYLKLLANNKRYASAWQHIQNPNPVAFSKALKEGGYYTANESDYTKQVSALYNKFNKSKSYDVARSTSQGNPMPNYFAQRSNQSSSQQNAQTLDSILTRYLQQVAASEKPNKRLYKKHLPSNQLVISINAKYDEAVEFARILCAALDEELLADAFTHTDGQNVDVQVTIHGPSDSCFNAVREITTAVAGAFKKATAKIGGIEVNTQFSMNKTSSYQEISLTAATNQHRKFLLKFI